MRELKKYPNRRLYDLTDSRYVTLHDARTLILAGESIRVVDSTGGSDITRSILLQILVEQEAEPVQAVLTERALEWIIRGRGHDGLSSHVEKALVDALEHRDALPVPGRGDDAHLEN